MNRYWISWYQPTEDYRPLTDPPAPGVLAWWCSGYGEWPILCALASAPNEAAAKDAILASWPEATDWRFCEPADDWQPSERFPITKDWERERLGIPQ